MSDTPHDPHPSRPDGLQSMLARLKGMVDALSPEPAEDEETPPREDRPDAHADEGAPEGRPPAESGEPPPEELVSEWNEQPETEGAAPEEVGTLPLAEIPLARPAEGAGEASPADLPEAESPPVAEALPVGEAVPVALECPVCSSAHTGDQPYCGECGYHFTPADLAGADVPQAIPVAQPVAGNPGQGTGSSHQPGNPSGGVGPGELLQGRFELGNLLGERLGIARFRGRDRGDGSGSPVPVIIVRQAAVAPAGGEPGGDTASPAGEAQEKDSQDAEILPTFDDPFASAAPSTAILPHQPTWPDLAWEQTLLGTLEETALPRVCASFTEGGYEYLVEEVPAGRPLWDAWDDPESTAEHRFGWLQDVAETLHHLHNCHAMLEGIRPDIVVVGEDGRARITDLSDLLPLPVPPNTPVRGLLYTAPELLATPTQADARAELYSFGALLYALHVGRELSEVDFDGPGIPKPFIPRFPDIHPAFGRLMMKTFRREVEARFPTDEASKEDPTGFLELIRTLYTLRRTFDDVRLEIASWTTTGMVRSGNEDAFALIHACESRQDDLGECALLLLCDGMGGYEAGEVAAAMTLQVLRTYLLEQPPFAALAGASPFPGDVLAPARAEGHAGPAVDVEECQRLLKEALREANRQVYAASRTPGSKRRGMGCTAEAVFVTGRHVIVGHVGDSRTYHLHEGRLIQLTRDQTLVGRLVELGTLTPEEAENHPRRNELQQAVGGQPDVEPGVYHGVLKPGDWVLVCSDGLTNHVRDLDLKEMLLSEAQSAEMAARRLVNLTNIEGATDNCTVVVVRAT
jgi:serine/threonine protein phosphatase PrpC